MKSKDGIWESRPVSHDYSAAHDFLTLLFTQSQAAALVRKLRAAPTITRQAKDLLRASRSELLARDNPHVADDLRKIKKGKKLSPVLLVRGDGTKGAALVIADGHHRICASWYWNENTPVACRLVSI